MQEARRPYSQGKDSIDLERDTVSSLTAIGMGVLKAIVEGLF